MSNVEYRCPTRFKTGCGSKMFGAPGGTRLKCTRHDVLYEQTEFYAGASFEFIEDDNGKSRTGTATHVRTHQPTSDFPDILKNIKDAPVVNVHVVEDAKVITARLRQRYYDLYHNKADKRWGDKRLRSEITRKEQELEVESQRKSAEAKALADAAALAAEQENT